MPLEITRMTEADFDGAIHTIQTAFADDPYNNWVFDKTKFNVARNRASLRLRCQWGISHGLFYVARDPTATDHDPSLILGTAMWIPPRAPGTPQPWTEYLFGWWMWIVQGWLNLRYGRGGLNVKRYWIWKKQQTEAQATLWSASPEPNPKMNGSTSSSSPEIDLEQSRYSAPKGFYFCNIVTVLPGCQGKGVGRALLETVLRKADEEGLPCYLESSRREPNVPIYEKFGFELVKEMVCEEGGDRIELFCMIRPPKPAGKHEELK